MPVLPKSTPQSQPNYEDLSFDEIEDDTTVGIFGPRGCGKTTLIYYMLSLKGMKRGIVQCATPECWVTYSKWLEKPYIYQGFYPDKLCAIMNYQNLLMKDVMKEFEFSQQETYDHIKAKVEEQIQKKREQLIKVAEAERWSLERFTKERDKRDQKWGSVAKEECEEAFSKGSNRRFRAHRKPYTMFVVFDDLGSDGSLRDEIIKKSVNNGRHYGMLLIFALQNPIDFPAHCRQGLNWLFLFYETKKSNLKNLFEKYASSLFETIEDLKAAMKWASEKNGVLVLHVNHPEQHILARSVFFWKSPKKLPYHPEPVGSEEFVKEGHQWFDEERHSKMLRELDLAKKESKRGKKTGGKTKDEEANVQTEEEEHKESEDRHNHRGSDNEDEDETGDEKQNRVSLPKKDVLDSFWDNDDEDRKRLWEVKDLRSKADTKRTENETDSKQKVDKSSSSASTRKSSDQLRPIVEEEEDEKELIRTTQQLLREDGKRAKKLGDLQQQLFVEKEEDT